LSAAGGNDRSETPGQVARFLVVGTSSVAVDLATYALLTALTPLAWSAAKGLSYAAGVFVGFFGNKFWTFGSRRRSPAEPAMYLALYACTLLVNIAINHLALSLLGNEFRLTAFLAATGVTMVANFLGMKLFAFRRGIEERRRAAISGPHFLNPES
jgi:putative flippase GtrA